MDVDVLVELIARAYEAGADPEQWPLFVEALGKVTGDDNITIQVHDLQNPAGSIAYDYGQDPEVKRLYNGYYGAINPWVIRGTPLLEPGRVLLSEMAMPISELQKTEFYADFLRPVDVLHSACAVIARENATAVFLSLQRSGRRGGFSTNELALLDRLVPHLQRAMKIHRKLGAFRAKHQGLVEIAERLAWGVMLLDRRREIVYANATARTFDRRTTDKVLRIAHAGGGALARDDKRPVAISAYPMKVSDPLLPIEGPSTIVFVVDPDTERTTSETWLRRNYRLTAAEARLAVALARGETLDEIAEATRTRITTLRTHLRRVFAKTQTRRQSELVRLVLLGAPIE